MEANGELKEIYDRLDGIDGSIFSSMKTELEDSLKQFDNDVENCISEISSSDNWDDAIATELGIVDFKSLTNSCNIIPEIIEKTGIVVDDFKYCYEVYEYEIYSYNRLNARIESLKNNAENQGEEGGNSVSTQEQLEGERERESLKDNIDILKNKLDGILKKLKVLLSGIKTINSDDLDYNSDIKEFVFQLCGVNH